MDRSELNPEYWSRRYLEQDTGWDAGAITTPLKEYADQLKDKELKILIPGAGNAHEAEYLFKQGFRQVYVCDVASEPLANLKQRCPEFDPTHLLLSDFFELQQPFDLIVEQTFFCALHPSQRPAYFAKMASLLKPGGRLVGLLFNDTLNSTHPPYGGNREEYLGYIQQAPFRMHTLETACNSISPRKGRELFMNLQKI